MELESADLRMFSSMYDEFQNYEDPLMKRLRMDYSPDYTTSDMFFSFLDKRVKCEPDSSEDSDNILPMLDVVKDEDEIICGYDPLDLVCVTNEPELELKEDVSRSSISDSPSSVDEPMYHLNEKSSSSFKSSAHVVDGDGNITHDCVDVTMNITMPLNNLRNLLEKKYNLNLLDYSICLQDSQQLDPDESIAGYIARPDSKDGNVDFIVQLKTNLEGKKIINIEDVMNRNDNQVQEIDNDSVVIDDSTQDEMPPEEEPNAEEEPKPISRWCVAENFKKDMLRFSIPNTPLAWNNGHVRYWLQWAIREFSVTNVQSDDWDMDGKTLCKLTCEEYKKKAPGASNHLFWTHLELLRKCNFVATIHPDDNVVTMNNNNPSAVNNNKCKENRNNMIMCRKDVVNNVFKPIKRLKKAVITKPKTCRNKILQLRDSNVPLHVSKGTNGQIQLWQFLLELLTDKHYRKAIQWSGDDGEFKLLDPEMVAYLWGVRKNKPTMNYEKLSRALRYYYEGDMISKVHGKRFVYKFDCDLKSLLGYSAQELNKRVIEAEKNFLHNHNK